MHLLSHDACIECRSHLTSSTCLTCKGITLLKILIPLFIAYFTGGLWVYNQTYFEQPHYQFGNEIQVLLLQDDSLSQSCLSAHSQSCNMSLRYGEHSSGLDLELLLFNTVPNYNYFVIFMKFDVGLKKYIKLQMESIVNLKMSPRTNSIEVWTGLSLIQKSPLKHDFGRDRIDISLPNDTSHTSLNEFILQNNNRHQIYLRLGKSIFREQRRLPNSTLSVKLHINYSNTLIRMRPSFGQVMLNAWTQYWPILFIVDYFVDSLITYMLNRQILGCNLKSL